MNGEFLFLAQAQQGQASGGTAQLFSLVPFVIVIGAMFYIMYRTQKKEAKRREEMIGSVKTGDKVLTVGGIYGIVSNVKDDCFVVKIADNVKIEVAKSAVNSVVNEKAKEEKK